MNCEKRSGLWVMAQKSRQGQSTERDGIAGVSERVLAAHWYPIEK
jgi:hypothetical protein